MHNVALVGIAHAANELKQQLRGLACGHRRAREPGLEVSAMDQLQDQVRTAFALAHLVDLDDIGMLQAGDRFCFSSEAGNLLRSRLCPGPDDLEGHQAV